MNIVVIGAGAIGSHVAQLLSQEENNVILVDTDQAKLDRLGRNLDVGARLGSGTDWQLLDELLELQPELLVAVTPSDEINLVACSIAKHLGYPQTVARVSDPSFFHRTRLDFERIFHVDHFIGPDILVAQDIFKTIISPEALSTQTFAHGSIQMRTVEVPERWRKSEKKLYELGLPKGMMVGLIRRPGEGRKKAGNFLGRVIFPHGGDSLLPGDEVTLIGEGEVIDSFYQSFGTPQKKVRAVAIMGGSRAAVSLARILRQHGCRVMLIDKDYDRCSELAESMHNVTIIHHDATEVDFLRSQRIDSYDVFVSCTRNDEVNLLAAGLAKDAGVDTVVSMISDTRYLPLVKRLGIGHTVSPRLSAANRVLAVARPQAVTSMVSLYDGEAEIMEIKVSAESPLAGIPISELGPKLPKDFLIAVIRNRGRIMVAHGARIMSPGDTVVVISHPRHIQEFYKIF